MIFPLLFLASVDDLTWTPGTNIQRTMRLLATSTPAKRNKVKILFYGQSITRQDWWRQVETDLRKRFPYANLKVENRAIGGFAADRLKRTVIHDVFPSYPDLIILHDYGGEPDYEELIRSIRENVSSEVLVQSDHVVWTGAPGQTPPRSEVWHDAHVGWLRNLAQKYRMGFVDVRTSWHQYLAKNSLPASDLLRDGVHLNDKGSELMASLIEPALVYNPKLPEDSSLVQTIPAQRITSFDGNRMDVLAGTKDLSVEIDGKKPSVHPELVTFDRPSDGFGIDVPALERAESRRPLVPEEWTISLVNISRDVSSWRFVVRGSQTGEDGEGFSNMSFVSRSGRVVINPGDWYVHEANEITGRFPPEGFEVKFQARVRGSDIVPKRQEVTVANGLSPGVHRLTLRGVTKGAIVTIYRPPFSFKEKSPLDFKAAKIGK